MGRVRFSDVVKRVNVFVDREHTDLLYYVGGEHIDSDAFMVRKNGLIKGATIGYKFHFGFQPGHILFMSRNPHLRKCSMVDFAGVCSDSTYVVETRDENVLLQKYLLIEMQSDRFWKWAEENKSGSVNYLINWSTLAEYEFDLPPIEEQRALAEKLWAANDLKEKYRHLLAATDEMLKAKFREMFGEIHLNDKRWPEYKFKDVADSRLGKMLDAKKQTGKCMFPYLANINVQWFRFDLTDLKQMDFDDADQQEFALRDGDVLVCEGGVVGRSCIWHNQIEKCFFQKALHRVRCNREFLIPEFLVWWFYWNSENHVFDILGKKTTIAHLPGEKLKTLDIALPPIKLQREFVDIANAAEASKAELKKSIASIDAVMKGLING